MYQLMALIMVRLLTGKLIWIDSGAIKRMSHTIRSTRYLGDSSRNLKVRLSEMA